MSNGDAVTRITLATTDTWKDKSGEKKEKTEWHTVVFYRKLAEIAGEYLKKGRSVYVDGRLETKKWTDKNGVERYTTQIIADDMKMLGNRPADDQQQSNQSTTTTASAGATQSSGFDDMDDDIQF